MPHVTGRAPPGTSAAGWRKLVLLRAFVAGCGGLWLRMASLLLHECCQHGGLMAQVWVWAVAVGWWGVRRGVCHGSAVLLSSLRALKVAGTHHGTTFPYSAASSLHLPWQLPRPPPFIGGGLGKYVDKTTKPSILG